METVKGEGVGLELIFSSLVTVSENKYFSKIWVVRLCRC